jgi:cardiolipin synthase
LSLDGLAGFWSELFLVIAYVAWAIGVTSMLLVERRAPVTTVAWLLTLLLLPYVGAIVYFFFGPRRLRRKRMRYASSRSAIGGQSAAQLKRPRNVPEDLFRRYQQLATLAERLGQPSPERSESVKLYLDGDAFYTDLLEAIAGANHHVHLEYYIWRSDGIGTRVRDALVERAKAGVKVRVLVDNIGSNTTRDAFFAPLEAAGGEVAWFNRPRLSRLRLKYLNFRTHRKILVADGRVAFTGGMNVTDDHSSAGFSGSGTGEGGARAPQAGKAGWRDTSLRVTGAPVAQLQRVFLDDWMFAYGRCDVVPELFPELPAAYGPLVQIVASGPDLETWAIHRVMFNAIANARSNVTITTAYFVPDEPMLAALVAAALRGVAVRILVPKESDAKLVTAAGRTYFDELSRAGVEILEYGPPMLHAKTAVFDDLVSVIGTANFDNRSFKLNFEVVAVIYAADVAKELNARFEADCAGAVRYPSAARRPPFHERLLMGAARLFSPLL